MRFALVLLVALAGCTTPPPRTPPAPPPPPALKLDPFYARYLDAGGIPIVSSRWVPPEALVRARDIVDAMLEFRPDLRAQLITEGTRVAVMAEDEGTLDLPEQRGWKKPARDDPRLSPCERMHYDARIGRLSDRDYWNARARGMGGTLTSVGAENLLAIRGTRYFGQNVLVHEFAHAILRAAQKRDPGLFAEVERAYRDALAAGRWRGEYAAVSAQEYWAIGTQIWFETGVLVRVDGARSSRPTTSLPMIPRSTPRWGKSMARGTGSTPTAFTGIPCGSRRDRFPRALRKSAERGLTSPLPH